VLRMNDSFISVFTAVAKQQKWNRRKQAAVMTKLRLLLFFAQIFFRDLFLASEMAKQRSKNPHQGDIVTMYRVVQQQRKEKRLRSGFFVSPF